MVVVGAGFKPARCLNYAMMKKVEDFLFKLPFSVVKKCSPTARTLGWVRAFRP